MVSNRGHNRHSDFTASELVSFVENCTLHHHTVVFVASFQSLHVVIFFISPYCCLCGIVSVSSCHRIFHFVDCCLRGIVSVSSCRHIFHFIILLSLWHCFSLFVSSHLTFQRHVITLFLYHFKMLKDVFASMETQK